MRDTPADRQRLNEWKRASRHAVTLKTARDARTKFMLENKGKRVVINYKGAKRTIWPQRVFTIPDFRKSYVEAKVGIFGLTKKTFDIDDIKSWKLAGSFTTEQKPQHRRKTRGQDLMGCCTLLATVLAASVGLRTGSWWLGLVVFFSVMGLIGYCLSKK